MFSATSVFIDMSLFATCKTGVFEGL